MSIEKMRTLMVGRELTGSYYRDDYDGSTSSEVLLRADNITLRPYFKNISLELHRGEILGFGGLSDCGMHEIGRVLFGIEKTLTGSVTRADTGEKIKIPVVAVKQNIAYISKDRDKESIDINGSIRSNIILPSLQRLRNRLGAIPLRTQKKLTDE